jgi:hypothetical protein
MTQRAKVARPDVWPGFALTDARTPRRGDPERSVRHPSPQRDFPRQDCSSTGWTGVAGCRLEPSRLRPFQDWLAQYEQAWNDRLDRVDDYLKELQHKESGSDT